VATAYSAGVAAGAAGATTYVMGANYALLHSGCASPDIGGNTWFQPFYGANGIYYRVIPTP
jgi:hypothetical protein